MVNEAVMCPGFDLTNLLDSTVTTHRRALVASAQLSNQNCPDVHVVTWFPVGTQTWFMTQSRLYDDQNDLIPRTELRKYTPRSFVITASFCHHFHSCFHHHTISTTSKPTTPKLQATMLSSFPTLSTSLTIRSSGNNKRQQQHSRLADCTAFAGRPLSHEQASDKLDRCPVFRQTVSSYQGSRVMTLEEKAIQVDYGMRLRSCIYARPAAKAHHNGHLPY